MTVNDIRISGHDFEVTEAMKKILHKKFERLLKHYGHFITDVEVLMKIANDHRNIAETNVHVPDKTINASASTDDMYKSIDEMVNKVKVQLEKYKETHLSHKGEERMAEQLNDEDLDEDAKQNV